MNINIYFEFPYPDIDKVPYQPIGTTTSHLHSAILLYKKLENMYTDFQFNAIDTTQHFYNNEYGLPTAVAKFSHFYVIIENPDTKKYFCISYWDKLRGIFDNAPDWDLENMAELFACCGTQDNEINYQDYGIKYTPSSNMCLHITAATAIEELRHTTKSWPEKLKFKGGNYDFRSHVYRDGRISIDNDRIAQHKFIKEYAGDSVMIDINAASEISHRTFDAFGLGAALIRPKLTIRYHNPLIPNYHYAALDCDDLGDWDAHLNAYFETFEELKKNPDRVRDLAHQGRLWYEQNATTEAHANLLSKLLDFTKLT
tara:strand:- start:2525 stop:3463 length:939 start_codon:yes stop_codon:yes gene_type:complete